MHSILFILEKSGDGAAAVFFPFFNGVIIETSRPDLFSTSPRTPGKVNVYVGENGEWIIENKSGVQRIFTCSELRPRLSNDEPNMSVWETALDNIPDL